MDELSEEDGNLISVKHVEFPLFVDVVVDQSIGVSVQ